ncbi:MAG TPA: hypothetical protein VE954_27705, partial [Oligoflexus sp.]|uniref:hypothetical protein n=1 Tax=Oligoflexus sp. TaxID=1971216 RepID=UPI002D4B0621
FWKKSPKALAPQPSPAPASVADVTPPAPAPSAPALNCTFQNTIGRQDDRNEPVPTDLQFKADVEWGDRFAFAVPFDLQSGQAFDFTIMKELGSSYVSKCKTEGKSIQCAETFEIGTYTLCGDVKLADDSKKFIEMTVNIRYKAPPLPKDLDQYAVESEDRAIGVLMRQIEDKAGGYLPIKIWASADPQAKLVGEVPSGFFAYGLTTSTVYVKQVGDRFLTKILGKPEVFHWISGLEPTRNIDIVSDHSLCSIREFDFCQNPSVKDCETFKGQMDFLSSVEVDKSQPILSTDVDWVVLVSKQPSAEPEKVYISVKDYVSDAYDICD